MNNQLPTIALGFNIFLEHILRYDIEHEKGRLKIPPRIQLGSGSWNIAKTLQSLGVNGDKINVLGIVGLGKDPDSKAIASLLSAEDIRYQTLPIRSSSSSSYYLIPAKSKSFAFGYLGGPIKKSANNLKIVQRTAKNTQIRVVCEITDEEQDLLLAKTLLKKDAPKQLSVFIPSMALIVSKKLSAILPFCDLLALNDDEAITLLGKSYMSNLRKIHVPYIFVTHGKAGAVLKLPSGEIMSASVKPVLNPLYVGGAGDAATAGLIYGLFAKKMSAQNALRLAMKLGRETLLLPTSYWTA